MKSLQTLVASKFAINALVNGSGNYGFNAANDTYGDAIEMGIFGPSESDTLCITKRSFCCWFDFRQPNALVAELPEDKPAAGGMGGHDMGGMGGMGGMM